MIMVTSARISLFVSPRRAQEIERALHRFAQEACDCLHRFGREALRLDARDARALQEGAQ